MFLFFKALRYPFMVARNDLDFPDDGGGPLALALSAGRRGRPRDFGPAESLLVSFCHLR